MSDINDLVSRLREARDLARTLCQQPTLPPIVRRDLENCMWNTMSALAKADRAEYNRRADAGVDGDAA